MRDLTPGEYGVLRDILIQGCPDLKRFRIDHHNAWDEIDALLADTFLKEENGAYIVTPRGLVTLCDSGLGYAQLVYALCQDVAQALARLLHRDHNRTYSLSE